MTRPNANYFKEYNQRPKRKEYLNQKSLERYYKSKKGLGKLICPNCSTVCEISLEVKK